MRKDPQSFMLENEIHINESIGKLLYLSCIAGPILFLFTKIGVFEIETSFCVIFTIIAILTGIIQQLLIRNPKNHRIARYFGIISVEGLIGFAATQAAVGIYISYALGALLSCLYLNAIYTTVVCIASYVVLLVSLYVRSYDLVEHAYIKTTALEHFITFGTGFTIEFLLLFLVCRSIVKYEEELLNGQAQELLERIEAQEENRAKSDFLAQMSHEIRTPINAVLGMNEMILREANQPEIVGYASTIRNAGKSLLNIVNDILDFSKIQSGRMEIVPTEYDTASLLRDLIELYSVQAVSKGLDFEYQIAENIPRKLFGDEYRIKQAAGNLISNAIKYTQQGFVNLQVDYMENEEQEGRIVFSVIDSGIGIKSEDIPKLFQDFGRLDIEKNRAIEGTGLGLKISKQLIEMMGGTLTVQSVYGEGSIFSITIGQKACSEETVGRFADELKRQEQEGRKSSDASQILITKDVRILIVDDNEMNLQVAASLLKKTKAEIECVLSGKECLEAVLKNFYDIILLDHMMPEMDGIETLKHLKGDEIQLDRRTRVIVLTANAISGAREKYLEEGFDDYISKPIGSGELERVLLEHLPANKICMEENEDEQLKEYADLSKFHIDCKAGVQLLDDDMEVYVEMAKVFCGDYEGKKAKLQQALRSCDMESYAILVHGLKSNARTLGANQLGELAYEEEMQSKAGNILFIQTHFPKLLCHWELAIEGFNTLFDPDEMMEEEEQQLNEVEATKGPLKREEVVDHLLMIMACLEGYQTKEAENAMKDLLTYSLEEELRGAVLEAMSKLQELKYETAIQCLSSYIL